MYENISRTIVSGLVRFIRVKYWWEKKKQEVVKRSKKGEMRKVKIGKEDRTKKEQRQKERRSRLKKEERKGIYILWWSSVSFSIFQFSSESMNWQSRFNILVPHFPNCYPRHFSLCIWLNFSSTDRWWLWPLK